VAAACGQLGGDQAKGYIPTDSENYGWSQALGHGDQEHQGSGPDGAHLYVSRRRRVEEEATNNLHICV
jgi:hypothetical protein